MALAGVFRAALQNPLQELADADELWGRQPPHVRASAGDEVLIAVQLRLLARWPTARRQALASRRIIASTPSSGTPTGQAAAASRSPGAESPARSEAADSKSG